MCVDMPLMVLKLLTGIQYEPTCHCIVEFGVLEIDWRRYHYTRMFALRSSYTDASMLLEYVWDGLLRQNYAAIMIPRPQITVF